jgi:hypothetical protein
MRGGGRGPFHDLHHGHRPPLAAVCIFVFFDALFLPGGGDRVFRSLTAAVGGSSLSTYIHRRAYLGYGIRVAEVFAVGISCHQI